MVDEHKHSETHQRAMADLRARLARVDEALGAWASLIAEQWLPAEQRRSLCPPEASLERLNKIRALIAEELAQTEQS